MALALISFVILLLDSNDRMASSAILAMISTFWFVFLALIIFQIYCYCRVAQKSGYPGAYSLLLLIPLVNIVISLIWVFSEWPIEAELKRLRAAGGASHP
jgi:uncharacterized membrane protein YhaH (DUF805 family)